MRPKSGRDGKRWQVGFAVAALVCVVTISTFPAAAEEKKPNILVLWGDDIGQFNISAYNMGMMGYKTPNIDRIAREGALFTDWYGQQSFREFPPRQKPGSFNLERVMEAVTQPQGSGR